MKPDQIQKVAELIIDYAGLCRANNEPAVRVDQCDDQFIVLIEAPGQHHAFSRLSEKLRWDNGFEKQGPGRGRFESDFAFKHGESGVASAVNELVLAELRKRNTISVKAEALGLDTSMRMDVSFHVSVGTRYVVDVGRVVHGRLDMILNAAGHWTPANGNIGYALRELTGTLMALKVKDLTSLLHSIEAACIVACGEYDSEPRLR